VCGSNHIHLEHRITRICHRGNRIEAIVANNSKRLDVNRVINTLPLPLFIAQMDPPAPPEILEACGRIQFRDVLLVGLILNRPRVMKYATLYFPSPDYPFTRVYEPVNRSAQMAPQGRTSLFVEIPMPSADQLPDEEAERLAQRTAKQLCETGLIAPEEIQDTFTLRLPRAYPVLEVGVEEVVAQITDYLSRFENLVLTGRNGRFEYAHLHDMLRWGKDAAAQATLIPTFHSGGN
jgi:protoporphyrinogen oxidase